MRLLLWLVVLAVLMGGCQDFSSVNTLIAQQNQINRQAYADSLVACKGEQGCLVGVTMAYALNVGQQQFYKSETGLDWVKALSPYIPWVAQIVNPGGTHGSVSPSVKGDGNVFLNNYGTMSNSPVSAWFNKRENTEFGGGSVYSPDNSGQSTINPVACPAGQAVDPNTGFCK